MLSWQSNISIGLNSHRERRLDETQWIVKLPAKAGETSVRLANKLTIQSRM